AARRAVASTRLLPAAPLPPAPLPLILACVCLAAAHGISSRRTAVLVCSGLVRVGGPAAVLRIVLPAVVSGSIAARICNVVLSIGITHARVVVIGIYVV